jgi:hypothetical protein
VLRHHHFPGAHVDEEVKEVAAALDAGRFEEPSREDARRRQVRQPEEKSY